MRLKETVRPQDRRIAVAGTASRVRWVAVALILLGVAIVTCVVLGPLVLDLMVYRVSQSARRQVIGVDATGLLVVAPSSIAIGVAVLRGRRNLLPLGLAPAVFAAYTYSQLFVGNEYLHRPGNIERFAPLLLATFVLASAVIVGVTSTWLTMPPPPTSPRADRVAGADVRLRRRVRPARHEEIERVVYCDRGGPLAGSTPRPGPGGASSYERRVSRCC